jgi:Family of unknown function (DUF6807)
MDSSQDISFNQSDDGRIDLRCGEGPPIATYRYEKNLPKPCFHPLRTAAGHEITGFEMPDHPWHRGLWFAIKYVNGSNFWEERPPFGIQKTEGRPQCRVSGPGAVSIDHDLTWTSQATGPVIQERRAITFAVRPDGVRQIDWSTSLEPLQELLLDRTPYTTWGGYGGLTFRAPYELHGDGYLLPDGQSVRTLTGEAHPWAVFRGAIKGRSGAKISLGIIDHPTNPRSPTPWYGKTDEGYDFMNAAFLFHEPMTIGKSRPLHFRFRVLYRDGWWEADEFARLADDFRKANES